ncbi:hypothetical protein C7G83_17720 [Siccibacter turicensis]|uniref:Uncharacterized protein n=1 Tax=Siccibacter turicensis TaxID=357233 RepID=A0A2P8VFU6_9ENTR|nr:hypothetical protein C7G83_17720 [Siccibacter turicensis]
MPVAPAGDAERSVSEKNAPALNGRFPAANHKKGSIFDPDFSIILRPHVTRKFFSRNFCVPVKHIRGGRFTGQCRVNLSRI